MMMKPNELPAPDTLIEYPNGSFGPLMFHYATEGDNLKTIASECGFDLTTLLLEQDSRDEVSPLIDRFNAGMDDLSANVEMLVADWSPPEGVNGWNLVGKWDTEDGPIALYTRAAFAKAAGNEEPTHD